MAIEKRQHIAMIYAEALDELAAEQNAGEAIQDELQSLANLAEELAEFGVFLETPAIPREQKKQSVRRMFETRVSPLTLDFLLVLTDKDRLGYLPEIAKSFSKLQDGHAGKVQGKLITAIPLNESEKKRINEQVNRVLHKKAILQFAVDPGLLGGMILQVEDRQADGSIRSQLARMAERLYRQGDAMVRQSERFIEMPQP